MYRNKNRTRLGLVLVAALLLAAPLAVAGVGDYVCSDPSKVYFGNSQLFQRPAGVDCDRIYEQIDEYKEIVRRGLTAKDAPYHLLMKKATQRFSAAVKKMARAENHDLVAQKGAVQKSNRKSGKKVKDVPDRTQDVIRSLE